MNSEGSMFNTISHKTGLQSVETEWDHLDRERQVEKLQEILTLCCFVLKNPFPLYTVCLFLYVSTF